MATDTYLISMALLGSIMVYPAGRMAYVDALFLSTGAVTQSGLNTWVCHVGWWSNNTHECIESI